MKLTLSVDSLALVKWWIDASHLTHQDCKGHTGRMMSLGKGAIISSSKKQKLNVRSSTEGELVGVDDMSPMVLWVKYFLESHEYIVEHNMILQDNKSAILLEKNGRASSSKRTKHIHARYFFIKDRIDKGDMEVRWCPTQEIWSDVLTKPKQGQQFRLFRSHMMNCPINYNEN